MCPPFFLLRGYPRERISYGSGACALRAVFPIRYRIYETQHYASTGSFPPSMRNFDSIGQAQRIPGVTPAAVALLLVVLRRGV